MLDMNEETSPCRNCGTPVPPTSTTCLECGYDVEAHNRWRIIWGIPGTLLTISIILAPLGLPMLWKAYRHRLAAEGTVTAPRSTTSIISDILSVDHNEPWPPWEAQGEFTRGGSNDSSDRSRQDSE